MSNFSEVCLQPHNRISFTRVTIEPISYGQSIGKSINFKFDPFRILSSILQILAVAMFFRVKYSFAVKTYEKVSTEIPVEDENVTKFMQSNRCKITTIVLNSLA